MKNCLIFSFLVIFCFVPKILLGKSNVDSSEIPKNQYPDRYIRFQGDNMGHKPWDHFVSYTPKANFNAAVFDKLIVVKSDYELAPGLIKSWKWNSKEKSYSLKIKSDAIFDETRKLKPVDIEFTILKHFISSVNETDRRLFYDIVGVEKLKHGMPFTSGMCKGIKIISPSEIKIYLKEMNPNFLYSLGDLVSPVAPVEDFGKDLFSFKSLPRGTGKYKVVWSSKINSLVRIQYKKIGAKELAAKFPLVVDFYNHGDLLKNNIDVASGFDARRLLNNPKYKVIKGPIPIGINVIDFNYKTELGSNIKFRQAISLALNREKLFKDSQFLKPYHEMIPELYYGRSGLKYESNPEKAKKIVKKYFSTASSPEKPLKALYHGDPSKPKRNKIREIEKQLAKVGIYIHFLATDGVYFTDKYRDAVLSTYGSVSSFVDPLISFANYLPGTAAPNNTNLKDITSIELFKKIKTAKTKNDRHFLIKKLSTHFHYQFRQVPLSEILQVYAFSNKVEDLKLGSSIMVVDFSKIILK